jgi:1-acyl-sn-glycerol-3-phosphate acyltransferase
MLAIHIGLEVLSADGYALMDAKNLQRLPFLGRVGAFGVDLTSRQDGVRALRYGATLLDRPGRLLWIYPQGRERPTFERLDDFQGGAAMIARMAKLKAVFPVGVAYHFGSDPAPIALVDIGQPLPHRDEIESSRKAQQQAVHARLDDIQAQLSRADGSFPGFECVLESKSNIVAGFAQRLLAKATRYR